jgi:Zn-dependent protease with chaperone function
MNSQHPQRPILHNQTYVEIPDSINISPENHLFAFLKYTVGTIFGVLAFFWVFTAGIAYLVPYLPPSSEKWLAPIGESYIKSLREKKEIQESSTYSALLSDLMRYVSPPPQNAMHVYEGLGDTLNAYALPGGHIVLYQKLMGQLNDEDAKRFVLAHEMGHVYHRHSLQAMGEKVIFGLLILPASVILPQATGQLSSLLNVSSMQYSQAKELEADRYAVTLLSKARYNPRAGIKVFQLLEAANKNNKSDVPDFLKTHPPDAARIAQIEALTQRR